MADNSLPDCVFSQNPFFSTSSQFVPTKRNGFQLAMSSMSVGSHSWVNRRKKRKQGQVRLFPLIKNNSEDLCGH